MQRPLTEAEIISIQNLKQGLFDRYSHSQSMPMSTPKSSQFRSPALKSSQFRPRTQQPTWFYAYTEVKSRSIAHAEIQSTTSTRKKSNSMRKLIKTKRVPAQIQKPSQFRTPAPNLCLSFPNPFDTYKNKSKFNLPQSIPITHTKTRQFRCSLVNQAIIGLHTTTKSPLSAHT